MHPDTDVFVTSTDTDAVQIVTLPYTPSTHAASFAQSTVDTELYSLYPSRSSLQCQLFAL